MLSDQTKRRNHFDECYSNYINKFADSEDEMFKDDDESKLQCEDVPVHRREVALLVPKTFVETFRLE